MMHPQYEVFGAVVSVAMQLEATANTNTIHISNEMRSVLDEEWSGLFKFERASDLTLGSRDEGTEQVIGTSSIRKFENKKSQAMVGAVTKVRPCSRNPQYSAV